MSELIADAIKSGHHYDITLKMKSGSSYTFNTADNEDIILESCEADGTIQISGGDDGDYGTTWVDINEVEAIQV